MTSLKIVQFSDQWFSTRASMARWFPSHGDETGDELGGFNPSQKYARHLNPSSLFVFFHSAADEDSSSCCSCDLYKKTAMLTRLIVRQKVISTFYRNQDLVNFEKIGLDFDSSKPCQRPEAVRKCPALPWRSTLRVQGMESMEFGKPWWIVTIVQSGTWGCNGYNNV